MPELQLLLNTQAAITLDSVTSKESRRANSNVPFLNHGSMYSKHMLEQQLLRLPHIIDQMVMRGCISPKSGV